MSSNPEELRGYEPIGLLAVDDGAYYIGFVSGYVVEDEQVLRLEIMGSTYVGGYIIYVYVTGLYATRTQNELATIDALLEQCRVLVSDLIDRNDPD